MSASTVKIICEQIKKGGENCTNISTRQMSLGPASKVPDTPTRLAPVGTKELIGRAKPKLMFDMDNLRVRMKNRRYGDRKAAIDDANKKYNALKDTVKFVEKKLREAVQVCLKEMQENCSDMAISPIIIYNKSAKYKRKIRMLLPTVDGKQAYSVRKSWKNIKCFTMMEILKEKTQHEALDAEDRLISELFRELYNQGMYLYVNGEHTIVSTAILLDNFGYTNLYKLQGFLV